ncbi:lipoprotein [Streptomyces crystallinus]|uniref:Lipoprotein n=1 Tax=Streptomyces crystallinus TaxID=68191 RepID=A0ABN1F8Z1_9ACTN
MRVWGRGIALATAGAALAVMLAGCGSGESEHEGAGAPESERGEGGPGEGSGGGSGQAGDKGADVRAALTAAARKTGEQASYKTLQTGAPGSGHSEMLFQKSPSASVIKAWHQPSKADPRGFTQMVSVGGKTYVSTDDLPGKSWYTMDDSAYAGRDKGSGGARAAGYVPEFTGALAASPSTRRVGEERVGGRPADHYRGTVVMDELAAYTGPSIDKGVRDGYVAGTRQQGMKSVVIDVWVGKDGLVLKSQEAGRGSKGPELVVEEYSDFGKIPAITAPAANTVATWEEFIDGLSQRS